MPTSVVSFDVFVVSNVMGGVNLSSFGLGGVTVSVGSLMGKPQQSLHISVGSYFIAAFVQVSGVHRSHRNPFSLSVHQNPFSLSKGRRLVKA